MSTCSSTQRLALITVETTKPLRFINKFSMTLSSYLRKGKTQWWNLKNV